ncbi:MAG: nucleotidyl transferase AbiEii/AbiGii toxin family protein, partial [Bacteroidetes bacterium]|nr:nucleotidyl transferase AbiEii/AbiGii toxin family protein [Bacteroidota bacterium]
MSSAASIRARLMNISREESIPFQVLIFRFLHERLLYRMSRTKWADSFVLKGGNLMYAQQGILTRPTKDIDYLAVNLRNDISLMTMVFAEVCTESYSDDSVWFDEKSISAETISEQEKYEGVRIHIQAGFDTISQQIQIDIGFGDIMTPQPEKIVYPVLLKELESPFIKAYSNETVIAEKFQTMIE